MSISGRLDRVEALAIERQAAERAATLAGVDDLVSWDAPMAAEYEGVLMGKPAARLGPSLSAGLARVRAERPAALAIGAALVRGVEVAGKRYAWADMSQDELMAAIAAIANSVDWESGAGMAVLYAIEHDDPAARLLGEALTLAEREAAAGILSPAGTATMDQERLIWAAIARLPELVGNVRVLMAERGLSYTVEDGHWALATEPTLTTE